MRDAKGGYYDHGQTAGTLTTGAASFVIYTDGHATVGTWGKDVRMTPQVAFVRQNLKPLISSGRVAKDVNANVESNWGATIGGDVAAWRSGVGVTAQGDIVYAVGDAAPTVRALANILSRAGAISAMQLDINQSWVSYMTYQHHLNRFAMGKHVIDRIRAGIDDDGARLLRQSVSYFFAANGRDLPLVRLRERHHLLVARAELRIGKSGLNDLRAAADQSRQTQHKPHYNRIRLHRRPVRTVC